MKFKKQIFRNYINMFGVKTKQRLIVIESDDWGSIRMPNKNVYNKLLDKGISLDKCPYSKFDCLENDDDFSALFSVLEQLNSKIHKYPIITTNFLTANPDFDKIKQNHFSKYEFESLGTSYKNNPKSDGVKNYINDGIKNRFIKPQFHGREHLNVQMWMNLLNENKVVKEAFDNNFFALSFNNSDTIRLPYLASFMKYNRDDDFCNIMSSGLSGFRDFFGFDPTSFIAPVYIWDDKIEENLVNSGIESIQGLYSRKQYSYYLDENPENISRNRTKENDFKQLQLVRNCFFEPSTSNKLDWVDECLKDVEVAFFWKRPAIICSHRINFVGGLSEANRDKNLKSFQNLIERIVKKWPDVIFVSSDEVTNFI